MTLRVGDLQPDSDLDGIRNSCDVYAWVVSILIVCKQILQLLCARHTTHGCVMWNAVSRLNQTWKWPHFAISNIKYDPRPENCACFYFAILCYQGKVSVGRLLLKRKHAEPTSHSYLASPLQDDHDKIMLGMLFPINHILLSTRPSILCVTHQMNHKRRNYSVGSA